MILLWKFQQRAGIMYQKEHYQNIVNDNVANLNPVLGSLVKENENENKKCCLA